MPAQGDAATMAFRDGRLHQKPVQEWRCTAFHALRTRCTARSLPVQSTRPTAVLAGSNECLWLRR
jgi:hypothetical protein